MVLEEKKVKNICNFYVSEYHLEIMLLPYISDKIDNEMKICIITEKNLSKTLDVVMNKVNLDIEKKEKIKKINWNNKKIENIEENSNIILIGSQEFINTKLFEIKGKNVEILVCYDYNEVKNQMQEIVLKYDRMLNTLGINKI